MTPISAVISETTVVKISASFAPARRLRTKPSMLLGLPSGTKPSPGSSRMQTPVKEWSNSSMETSTWPRAGSFSTARSRLKPSSTTKWLKFQWMMQGNFPLSFRDWGSMR